MSKFMDFYTFTGEMIVLNLFFVALSITGIILQRRKLCDSGIDICTYTSDGFGNYTGCRQGEYRLITGITNIPKTKPAKK